MEVLTADYGRTQAEEAQVLGHLHDLSKHHVINSNGLLGQIGVDPVKYPSQGAFYLGNNAPVRDPNVLENIARSVNPGFHIMQEAIDEWEDETDTLRREAENFKKGMDLIIGTNHSSLPDIGYVTALFSIKAGRLKDPELHRKLSIMLMMSKIVCFMGLNIPQEGNVPSAEEDHEYEYSLAETLSILLCHHELLSVPQTARVKESVRRSPLARLFKDYTEKHNEAVTHKTDEILNMGGVLAGAALGGTTEKPVDSSGKVMRMAPITKGTARIMMHERVKVLPVAVVMDGPVPKIKVCGIPQAVNSQADADSVMYQIQDGLNDMRTGKRYEYLTYNELVQRGEIPHSGANVY
jgi:hypothetical protein